MRWAGGAGPFASMMITDAAAFEGCPGRLKDERASVAAQGRGLRTEGGPIRYVRSSSAPIDDGQRAAIPMVIALMVLTWTARHLPVRARSPADGAYPPIASVQNRMPRTLKEGHFRNAPDRGRPPAPGAMDGRHGATMKESSSADRREAPAPPQRGDT